MTSRAGSIVSTAFGAVEPGFVAEEMAKGDARIAVFRGIPYATPPVGSLRWQPPHSPPRWSGVRRCASFGPACPQPERFFEDPLIREVPERISEDCLYLNVWTPGVDPAATHPVMVWIHGGGFASGWGHQRNFEGTALARKGVVVVTLNYRLGPLGFLAHPALSAESSTRASGNYGLLDQIAALAWVRDNVGAFGGDPAKVTVFGESAGGFSVNLLRVSPLARDLFHGAICQSAPGGTGTGSPLGEAEKAGLAFADSVVGEDCVDDSAKLRAIPAQALVRASAPWVSLAEMMAGQRPGIGFGPVVDDWVLRSGETAVDIPLLLGVNAEEGSYWAGLADFATVLDSAAGYRAFVEWRAGPLADELLALYPADRPKEVRDAFVQYFGDTTFVRDTRAVAHAMEELQSATYLYRFSRGGAGGAMPGAYHSKEIPYVFNNLCPGADATHRALAETMSSLWARFAATGDPNGPGLPRWPPFDRVTERHLELDAPIRIGHHLRKRHCDALDRLLD